MIPWLIVAAETVAAFAVMHFMKGKPQERRTLMVLFVLVFLASCAAIFLEGYLGGDSGWLKSVCFGLNLVCLLRMDDAKRKKKT